LPPVIATRAAPMQSPAGLGREADQSFGPAASH
jgi:hypothetical protein